MLVNVPEGYQENQRFTDAYCLFSELVTRAGTGGCIFATDIVEMHLIHNSKKQ